MKTANPNEVARVETTPNVLDQLLSSTVAHVTREREAEQRALKWPGEVNELLVSLAGAVRAVQDRVAVLERKLGISAD